ncbi:hypothetical protein R6Q59_014522 [Mikania micrantha]
MGINIKFNVLLMFNCKVRNIIIGLGRSFFSHSLNDKSLQVTEIRDLNNGKSNILKLYLESLEKWKQGQILFDHYEQIQNPCRQSQSSIPNHGANEIRYINQLIKEEKKLLLCHLSYIGIPEPKS